MAAKKPARKSAKQSASDSQLAKQMWDRYVFLRDNGHEDYLRVNDRCGRFWFGDQWEPQTLATLRQQRRPALTVNMVMTTTDTILGEQINSRSETRFLPRYGKNADKVAEALNKVYKHVSQGNKLTWLRSDVFEDGIITGRGFYEVRLDFSDNLYGEVRIERVDPKNVMLDADATEYDPDTWNDVTTTRWLTPDDVELLYGREKAAKVKRTAGSASTVESGSDVLDDVRDRVATAYEIKGSVENESTDDNSKYVRVLDRQYRVLVKRRFFVNLTHGDMRPIPDDWDDARTAEYLQNNSDEAVIEKIAKRIRWTVVACDTVLFDEWSPYEHFTIVPFFPHFRNGRTVGVVEQLLSIQELLNKTISQELHIVNTTANSGWKVKKGALQNMTENDLEVRGAETGLVAVLDDVNNMEKIQPNQIPSGIDRLTMKAEAYIKAVGVSDYMRGEARADVSARALEANQNQGKNTLARMMDNLNRSDVFLARAILSIVQQYYVEERVLYITGGNGHPDETVVVNQVTPEGQITNDLTLGEYMIVVDSAPAREALEDSQFDQALAMRKEGIAVPDATLIRNSRLMDKMEIIEQMEAAQNDPVAQKRTELEMAQLEADVQRTQAEATRLMSDAANKEAQSEQKKVAATKEAMSANEMTPEQGRTIIEKQRLEMDVERQHNDHALELRRIILEEQQLQLQREQISLQREQLRVQAITQRMQLKNQNKQGAEKSNSQEKKTDE